MSADHLKLVHSREIGPRQSENGHDQAPGGRADPLMAILPFGIAFAATVWLAAIYGTLRFFLG